MEATLIRKLEGFQGDARLYRVVPPAKYANNNMTNYVMVSAVYVPYTGPETYIFPADESGEVLSWMEMDGSFRGDLDHAEALTRAGYTTQPES